MTPPRNRYSRSQLEERLAEALQLNSVLQMNAVDALAAKERAEARVCDECGENRPEWCAQCRMKAREERDALKAERERNANDYYNARQDAAAYRERALKAESELKFAVEANGRVCASNDRNAKERDAAVERAERAEAAQADWYKQAVTNSDETQAALKERDALKAEIVGLKDAERTFHRDAMREEQRARKAESDLARLREAVRGEINFHRECKNSPLAKGCTWASDIEQALSASGPEPSATGGCLECGSPNPIGHYATCKSLGKPPAAPKCEHCAAGDHRTCWERKAGCCCSGGGRE